MIAESVGVSKSSGSSHNLFQVKEKRQVLQQPSGSTRIYYLQYNLHNHMHCMQSKYTLLAQMIRPYLKTIP